MTMNMSLIQVFMHYFSLWCTCFVFVIPLKHKETYGLRYAITSIIFCGVGFLINIMNLHTIEQTFISYLLAMFTFLFLCESKWKEVIYCSIWSVSSHKIIVAIWNLYLAILGKSNRGISYLDLLMYILFLVSGCVLIGVTVARFMPVDREYHIGPRQFISSLFLLAIFESLDRKSVV